MHKTIRVILYYAEAISENNECHLMFFQPMKMIKKIYSRTGGENLTKLDTKYPSGKGILSC